MVIQLETLSSWINLFALFGKMVNGIASYMTYHNCPKICCGYPCEYNYVIGSCYIKVSPINLLFWYTSTIFFQGMHVPCKIIVEVYQNNKCDKHDHLCGLVCVCGVFFQTCSLAYVAGVMLFMVSQPGVTTRINSSQRLLRGLWKQPFRSLSVKSILC